MPDNNNDEDREFLDWLKDKYPEETVTHLLAPYAESQKEQLYEYWVVNVKPRAAIAETARRGLPSTITLRSGETLKVEWEVLPVSPQVTDFEGNPVSVYMPIPSIGFLNRDMALDLYNNLYAISQLEGDVIPLSEIDPETGRTWLSTLGIDYGSVYGATVYRSLAGQLISEGVLTEAQMNLPDVQNYLIIRSDLYGGARRSGQRARIFQGIIDDVSRIATEPAFATYMRQMGAMGPISPEEQVAMVRGEDVTAQNIARLIRTKPAGETESEWLQDITKRLEPYFTEYGPRAAYATGLMSSVIPALTETYETAQTRLAEIEAGAEQATKFMWLPAQQRMMTPRFGYELPPPQAPLRDPFGPPKTDWDTLVAEAKPERIARL